MDKNISLSLTLEQVNIVLAALGDVSYTKSAPVIDAIKGQAIPQLQQETPEQPVSNLDADK